MTAKEWLERGWKLNREINALLKAQENAFGIACSSTASADGEKVKTSAVNSTENRFIKYVEFSKIIDERIDKLYDIQQEILSAINKISDSRLRTLLIERYINFKTWERIAVDMNYCWRQIHNLHGKALKNIALFCTLAS